MKKAPLIIGGAVLAGLFLIPKNLENIFPTSENNGQAKAKISLEEASHRIYPFPENSETNLRAKLGETLNFYAAGSDKDKIKYSRVFVNGKTYHEKLDTTLPGFEGGVYYLKTKNELFHKGRNIITYEIEDTLGNKTFSNHVYIDLE